VTNETGQFKFHKTRPCSASRCSSVLFCGIVRVERRLDGTSAARFRERYLKLEECAPTPCVQAKGLLQKPSLPLSGSCGSDPDSGGQTGNRRRRMRARMSSLLIGNARLSLFLSVQRYRPSVSILVDGTVHDSEPQAVHSEFVKQGITNTQPECRTESSNHLWTHSHIA
jgi:hypothetical protein